MRVINQIKECVCGSGLIGFEEYDARGIYLARCCENCRDERLAYFRPEILDDPTYEVDEDIDPGIPHGEIFLDELS